MGGQVRGRKAMSRRALLAGCTGLALTREVITAQGGTPSPPTQPLTGPGGRDYPFGGYVMTQGRGEAPTYRIFEPRDPVDDASNPDGPFPVVVFIPGCCEPAGTAMSPGTMRSWLEHLARRGNVVIYVVYPILDTMQVPLVVAEALADLATGTHVAVDLARVTIAGYSAGGPPAVSLLVDPPAGLPQPRALLLMAPVEVSRNDIQRIPVDAHVVVVQAETDPIVGSAPLQFWTELRRAGNVTSTQRSFITLRSDDHGAPALSADHAFAATDGGTLGLPFSLDALDWYGTWKYLDALGPCAYEGDLCEYVIGDTPQQRFMGRWSDGAPVTAPTIDGG